MKSNTWTWISGTNQINHYGVYGEIGRPSIDYVPRARSLTTGWFDSYTNELWLFGGAYQDEGGFSSSK